MKYSGSETYAAEVLDMEECPDKLWHLADDYISALQQLRCAIYRLERFRQTVGDMHIDAEKELEILREK